MHLQPKAADTSQNVLDIHKARNANELITVVARINTALRLIQHNLEAVQSAKILPIADASTLLTRTLQIQQELQAAHTVASALSDAKRERCITAITSLNKETLATKRRLMTVIHRESSKAVSDKLNGFTNVVHDLFRKIAEKVFIMNMYDGTCTYVALIARQVQLDSGFVSPEICVKLAECADGFKVCVPDGTFVNSEWTWFTGAKALREYLANILDYNRQPAPIATKSVPLIEGVVSVDVTDTLNVHFDRAALPSEINTMLRLVVPLVKKAVGAGAYDVLHRVVGDTGGRTLQLCLGKKKVVDTASLNRLYRVLKLQKATASAATALMESK